jgi:hypothetical protein
MVAHHTDGDWCPGSGYPAQQDTVHTAPLLACGHPDTTPDTAHTRHQDGCIDGCDCPIVCADCCPTCNPSPQETA